MVPFSAGGIVDSAARLVGEKLAEWFEEHPGEARQIVGKIIEAALAREAARKAELEALVAPAKAVFLDAKIESELVEMEPDEAREFLA